MFNGLTPSGLNLDRTGAAIAGGVYDHRGRALPSTSISEKCGVAVETFLADDGTGCLRDHFRLRHSQVSRRLGGLKKWKAVCDEDTAAIDSAAATGFREC